MRRAVKRYTVLLEFLIALGILPGCVCSVPWTIVKPKLSGRCIYSNKATIDMNSFTEPSKISQPARFLSLEQSNLKIAVQSALAAALCFGLSTGLFFWLITVQRLAPSAQINRLVTFFSNHLVPPDRLEIVGALGWGFLLSKISGYRKWWWLSAATILGVRMGTFMLYHGLLSEWFLEQIAPDASMHVRFGIILTIAVLCVTVSTGLLLGFVLVNWKASLMLAASTGFASVLAALITLFILGELGLRVGSGNAAMPKVTTVATMAAALAGGAVLGVMFSRYVRKDFQRIGSFFE